MMTFDDALIWQRGRLQIEQQQIVEFVSNVIHVIYMIRRVFVVRNYFKLSSVRKIKNIDLRHLIFILTDTA